MEGQERQLACTLPPHVRPSRPPRPELCAPHCRALTSSPIVSPRLSCQLWNETSAGGKEDGSWKKPQSPVPSPGWAGGHAYSRDGLNWSQWTRCYNTSVALTDGTTVNFPRRERPKLLFDKDGTPTHLYNGKVCTQHAIAAYVCVAEALCCVSARRYPPARKHIYNRFATQCSCQQTTLSSGRTRRRLGSFFR